MQYSSDKPIHKIIHLDMDCFFASVEEKYHPELKGKPVGVGGPPNTRSVLCTANYEARKWGVTSALPSSRAIRMCPHLIIVPPHFELYKKESLKVHQIISQYTKQIEPMSLDEAYLDVTEISLKYGSATAVAQEIKKRVQEELQLTVSVGVAPNKFLAKVASDWKKPDGLFVIAPQQVAGFVKNLPVENIFGVGKVTADRMHRLGINTCGDLQKKELYELKRHFGSFAFSLSKFSRGIDERPVQTEWERKSLSVETTFSNDLETLEEVLNEATPLYEDWLSRMGEGNYFPQISGLFVKLKFFDFKQCTHERKSTQNYSYQEFINLIQESWLNFSRPLKPIRLLGIGARLNDKTPNNTQCSFPFSFL